LDERGYRQQRGNREVLLTGQSGVSTVHTISPVIIAAQEVSPQSHLLSLSGRKVFTHHASIELQLDRVYPG
jgi:hypothetical protein